MSLRRWIRRSKPPRDEGSALVIAMAFVLIGALFVTPMLQYALTVAKSGGVQERKASRAEAVKAAFRIAMADPSKLYDACSNSGLHNEVTVSNYGLDLPVTTTCTTIKNATELDASQLRAAMSIIMGGHTNPVGTVGTPYVNNQANLSAWVNDVTQVSVGGKILLPDLPAHALTHPSSTGFAMPSWVGNCRVYFPGTYLDPITITSNTPVYFTSGIYYFENTVTISGSANVVVGGGAVEGCTDDQTAAFEAIGAPTNHNITGYGATWIFGAGARLLFNDATAGTGPSLQFNSRLVNDTDIASLSSRSVSILSVNGVDGGGGSSLDFTLAGQLFVPHSVLSTPAPRPANPPDAMTGGYKPSTLTPSPSPAPVPAIIDISLTTANPAKLWIPGYVGVPQGHISISVAPSMAAGKDVQLVGGVLAAYFDQTVDQPATLSLGIVNRVVQKTFKVVSQTTSGAPKIVSTALVQINDYGEYVVNAWEISTANS